MMSYFNSYSQAQNQIIMLGEVIPLK